MVHNFFFGFLLQNVQGLISGLLVALSICNFGRIFCQFQLYVYNEVPPFVCHLMPVPPRPGKTGPMSHQPTMVFSTQATKYLHLYKSLLFVKYFYSKLSGCVFCLGGLEAWRSWGHQKYQMILSLRLIFDIYFSYQNSISFQKELFLFQPF